MRHNLSQRENGRGETAHRVVRTDHSDHSFRGLMADMAAMAARYETLQEDEVIVPSGMARVTFGVRTVGPFCRRGVPPRPPRPP